MRLGNHHRTLNRAVGPVTSIPTTKDGGDAAFSWILSRPCIIKHMQSEHVLTPTHVAMSCDVICSIPGPSWYEGTYAHYRSDPSLVLQLLRV